jgi:hypothetical protein
MDWGMEKTFWFRLKSRRPMEKENAICLLLWMMKTNRLVAQVRRINFKKMKSLPLKKAKK